MSNALQILNEDEKKYFESRGDHEPEGYNKPSGEDSEEELADEGQESSAGFDGPVSEGDGAETSQRYAEDSNDENEYRQESNGKSSKRDFTKAYGIAESKRQELKAQLEIQARQNQMLQQQIQMLMQQQQQYQQAPRQQEAVADIPDPTEDPLGYQSYQLAHLNKTVTAQQQYLEQQARAYQEQQAVSALDNAYRASAVEFAREAPDFEQAYRFLEQSRINEYMALGYSPQEASHLLQEDERALAAKSFKERANPAERIYAAAKARGFNALKEESKLEKVSKGMQNGKSLPRAGGKNLEKGFDLSRIDEMSDAEFDKFFNQMKHESKKNGDYRKDFY